MSEEERCLINYSRASRGGVELKHGAKTFLDISILICEPWHMPPGTVI